MTDTLPRTIPTDPAEQERLMPEWVKVEVCRLWNAWSILRRVPTDVTPDRDPGIFAHAMTIWQWMPEPVEPDLLMAREVCAATCVGPNAAKTYREGQCDGSHAMKAALAGIKRGRELERETKP